MSTKRKFQYTRFKLTPFVNLTHCFFNIIVRLSSLEICMNILFNNRITHTSTVENDNVSRFSFEVNSGLTVTVFTFLVSS